MSNLKHIDKDGNFVEATDPKVAYQINMDDDNALNEVDRIKSLSGVPVVHSTAAEVTHEPQAVDIDPPVEDELSKLDFNKKAIKSLRESGYDTLESIRDADTGELVKLNNITPLNLPDLLAKVDILLAEKDNDQE